LIWVLEQRQHAVANQVHGRFVAGNQQQKYHGHEFVGAQAFARLLDGDEGGQEVVLRLSTACLHL
jgi:hypothetical protein